MGPAGWFGKPYGIFDLGDECCDKKPLPQGWLATASVSFAKLKGPLGDGQTVKDGVDVIRKGTDGVELTGAAAGDVTPQVIHNEQLDEPPLSPLAQPRRKRGAHPAITIMQVSCGTPLGTCNFPWSI